MAYAFRVMGGGFSAGQAKALAGGVNSNVTAAGTTQADATVLTASVSYLGTVGAGSGVSISPKAEVGDDIWVYNGGANAALIYPPVGLSAKINGQATDGGVLLSTSTGMLLKCVSKTQWVGVLSA